jgi:hypothetical protein
MSEAWREMLDWWVSPLVAVERALGCLRYQLRSITRAEPRWIEESVVVMCLIISSSASLSIYSMHLLTRLGSLRGFYSQSATRSKR